MDGEQSTLSTDDLHRSQEFPLVVEKTYHLMRQNPESLLILQHSGEIETLKKQIEEKQDEITRLLKATKDLKEQNNELKVALNSKDEEIDTLTTRINKLEAEKKCLEEKLGSVQVQLDLVKKEVEELNEKGKAQEKRNLKLKEEMGKISSQIESANDELERTSEENKRMKKELAEVKKTQQLKAGGTYRAGLQSLVAPVETTPKTEQEAMLQIGELFSQLQAKMYKRVFPQKKLTKYASYTVNFICGQIDKTKSPEDKKEAERRWKELKEMLKWNEETHEEAIKLLKKSRNDFAHPSISKQSLEASVAVMNEGNDLDEYSETLTELIAMWVKLSAGD